MHFLTLIQIYPVYNMQFKKRLLHWSLRPSALTALSSLGIRYPGLLVGFVIRAWWHVLVFYRYQSGRVCASSPSCVLSPGTTPSEWVSQDDTCKFMCMIHTHVSFGCRIRNSPPPTPKRSQELLYFDHANQLTNELEFLPLKWNVFQPHYFSWNFSLNPWSSLHVPVSVFHGGVEKNRPGEIIRGWNVPRDPLKGHVIVYSAALKYFSWKKSIYTKQHHKVAFEQLWKKTSLQISNYGAFAQAGPVACWCFYGHLARTEIAVLGPWRRGIVQVYIWSSRNKF